MTYILEWVVQTGWKQDLYFDYVIPDWLHVRTGWDQDSCNICKNRIRSGSQLRLTVDSQNNLRTGSKGDPQHRMRKFGSRCKTFSSRLSCVKSLCIFIDYFSL